MSTPPVAPFILGYYGRYGRKPLYAHGREHIAVLGPTGSGKTQAMMIPNALTLDDNLFTLDVSHELHGATSAYRTHCGDRCYKIAFGEPDGITHRWNPFTRVPDDPMRRVDALQTIADIWIERGKDEKPIWPGGARALFVGLSLLIWELRGKEALTPGELYRIAHAPVNIQKFVGLVLWKYGQRIDPSVTRLLGSIVHKPLDTIGSIAETLNVQLKMFESPVLDAATEASDFDLGDLRRAPMSIYLCVTPNQLERMRHIITIFISQTLDALLANVPGVDEPYGITMLLDETDSLKRMERLANSLTLLRKYHVRLCMILHSYMQLQEHYGRERATTMFGNAKYRIIYTTNEQGIREEISRDLGNRTERIETKSWRGGQLTRNEQYEAVPLMTPTALREMPAEDQLVLVEGVPAIYCKGGRKLAFNNRELRRRRAHGAAPVPALQPRRQPEIYGAMYRKLLAEKNQEDEEKEAAVKAAQAAARQEKAKAAAAQKASEKEAAAAAKAAEKQAAAQAKAATKKAAQG